MTSRRKPVAFLLYVCCACATTVVDTQCVSSCSANPCSWATQWPPRTTQIQCQQIPRYDRSTGDQHASKPTLQDQTSRNEYYSQIEKREGQTKIDNKEVTLYNKGNPIIACLAGFDQEIYDLMDEIKKHISKSKRHDVKVYFYLIENCKFYRLGSIVIDLKILQDILSKYSHYYCLDKKYLESYNENDCSSLENLILVPSFFGNKKIAPGDSNVKTPFEFATPIIREEYNTVNDENKNYINSDYIEVPNDEKHKTDISYEVLLPNEKDIIFKNINVKILPNPPEIKEHNSNAADFELENDNSKLVYFNDCEMTYNRQFPLNDCKLETELTQATKDRADYLSFYNKNLVGTVTDRKEFIDYNFHNIPSNLIELNDESKLQAVEQRHPAPNVWFSNIIPNEKVLSNNLLEINSFNKDYNNKQLEVPEKNKLKQILNLKTPQEDILNIQILKSNFVYPGIDRKYRIDSTTNDNQQSHLNPLQYENVGRLSELPFKNNQNHLIENNIKHEHSYSNNVGVADYLFTIPTLNKPDNNDEITTFYSNIPKKDSTVVGKANEKYKALPDTLMCSDLDKSDYLNCPKNYRTVNTSPWPSKYFSYTQSMKNAKDKVTICPFQRRFNKYFPICDTKHIPKLFYQASPCLRYNYNSKTNNIAISYQSDKENENPKCDFKCMPSNDNIEIPSNNNARFNLIENLNAGAVNEQYSTSRSEEPTLSYNKAPLLYHQEDKPSCELVYPSYVGLKPGTCDVKSQPFIQNSKANHLYLDTAMYNKKSHSNNDFIPANKFVESGNAQHTLPTCKHQNSNVDVINDIQRSYPINNQYFSNSNADSEKILPTAIEFVPKLNCKVMSSNKPTLQTVQDCYLHKLPSNVENFAKILNGYPIKSVSAKPQLCYLNAFELTNNVTMPEKTEHEFSNAAMDIKEPNLQSYEGTFPYNYKVPSNTDYFEDFRTYPLNTADNLSNQVSSNEQAKVESLKNNNPYILSFAPDTQNVNNIISVSPVVIDKSQLNNLQGTASNLNNFKRNNFIPNIFNNINDMETVNYYSYSRIPTKFQENTNPNTHYYPRNKNLVGSVPNANILPDSSVLTDAEKKFSIYTLINNRNENISLNKEIDNFQKVAEKAIPTAPFIDNLQATLHNKPDNIINNLVSDKISPNLNRKDFIENKTPIDMPLTFDINDIADKRYNKYSKNNEIELSPFKAIIEHFNCGKHLPLDDFTTDSQNELQGMKSTKILTPTTLKYASDTSVADNSMLTNDLNPTLCSLKIPPETDTNNVMSENFYYKLNPIETLISNAIKESHPLKDITFKSPVSRYSKPVSVVPETNKNEHKLQNREEYLDSNQQSIEKEIMINDYNILQDASNFTPSCNSFLQRPGMKNAPKNTPILLSESNGAVEVLNKNIVPISLQTEPMLSPENVLGAQTNPTLPTNLPIEAFINAKFKPLQFEPSYTNHMNPRISSYIPSLTKPDDREITEKSNFGSVAPIDKTLYNSNLLKMMSVATKHEPNPTKLAKIKGTGDIVQTALNFITFYSPNTKNTHLYRMKPEYKPRLYESAYSGINTNDLTNLAPFSSSIGPTLLNIPSEQSNLNIDKYENEQINIIENDNAKLNRLPENVSTLSNIGAPLPIVLNLHVPSSYSSEKSTEMNILDPNSPYSINDKRIIDTHPKKQSHTDISCINKENSNTKPIIEKVCDNNECLDINNYNNDDKFNPKPHTNNAKINKKYFNICKTINGKINEMTPKNLDHNILNQNQFDTNTRSISYVRDPVIESPLASLDHFNEVPIKMQELYPQRPKSNVLFNNQRNKCNHDIFNYINLQNLKEPALTFNPKTRIPDIYTQFNKLNPNVNEAEPLPNEDPTVSEYSAETPYSKFLALAPILKNQLQPNNPSSDCYVEQNPKVNEITLKYPTADKLYTSWDKSYVKCLKPSVYYPGGKHYSTLLEPNSKYSIDRPPHSNSVILDPKVNDLISKYTLDSYASSNKPKSYLTVNQYLKGNECPSVFFDKKYSMVNVPTSGYYTHDKLNTNMIALTSNNFDNSLRNLYNPYLKANDLVLERTKDKINVKNSYNQIPNTNSDIKYVKNDLPVESIEPYYSWLGNLNKDRKDKSMKSNENISHVQNIYQMQPNEGSTYWQGTPAIERHNRFIENASPIVEFKTSPTSAMNQIKQPVRLLKPHKSSENELKLYNIDPIAETKPIYSTYYSPSMMESPIVPQTLTPGVQIRPLNVENKPLYFENPAILKTKPKGQTSYLQNPITISENYNKLPHIFNLLKPSSTEVENEGTSLINTQAILENQTTLNFENQPLYLKTTNPIQENPFLYSPELEQTSETMSAYLQRPISANDSKDFGNSTWIAKNEATNSQISQPLFETQTTDSQKSKVSENYLKNLVNPPQIIDTKSKYFQNNGLFIDNPAKSNENSYKTSENKIKTCDDLKKDVYKYLRSSDNLKCELLTNKEINIPLGNIGLAKYTANDNPTTFTVKTEDPNIFIKAWNSNLKILKAKLVFETEEMGAVNFMPIIKTNAKLDPEKVQNIAKKVIREYYGEPIVIKGVYSTYKPYAVVYDVNKESVTNPNGFYILWPTYCNCGCFKCGCQCSWDTNGCKCNSV